MAAPFRPTASIDHGPTDAAARLHLPMRARQEAFFFRSGTLVAGAGARAGALGNASTPATPLIGPTGPERARPRARGALAVIGRPVIGFIILVFLTLVGRVDGRVANCATTFTSADESPGSVISPVTREAGAATPTTSSTREEADTPIVLGAICDPFEFHLCLGRGWALAWH